MNANIVYFIGIVFLIIGIVLTYYGNHLKSAAHNKTLEAQVEALRKSNTSLKESNNLLISEKKQLATTIDQYQKDSEEKAGTIKKLQLKATKERTDIRSDYDFFGAKRTTLRPGCVDVSLGPEFDVFNKMDTLLKKNQ